MRCFEQFFSVAASLALVLVSAGNAEAITDHPIWLTTGQYHQVSINISENSYVVTIDGQSSTHGYMGDKVTVEINASVDGCSLTTSGQSSNMLGIFFFGHDGPDTVNHNAVTRLYAYGHGGDDDIRGGPVDDSIDGGSGNDDLRGRGGEDSLMGGDGNDDLWGQAGDDVLWGGEGLDYLSGGLGDDTLYGNVAKDGDDDVDVLEGNGGCDTFYGSVYRRVPFWMNNSLLWYNMLIDQEVIVDLQPCDNDLDLVLGLSFMW